MKQTFQQVLRVLYADRDAYKVVGKPADSPDIGRDGGMAHVAGQRDGRADAAKADSNFEQLHLLCNCPARFRAAFISI